MLCSTIQTYTDSEIEKMFDQWGDYYNLLDNKGIGEDTPLAQVLKPSLPFTFEEIHQELMERARRKEA